MHRHLYTRTPRHPRKPIVVKKRLKSIYRGFIISIPQLYMKDGFIYISHYTNPTVSNSCNIVWIAFLANDVLVCHLPNGHNVAVWHNP